MPMGSLVFSLRTFIEGKLDQDTLQRGYNNRVGRVVYDDKIGSFSDLRTTLNLHKSSVGAPFNRLRCQHVAKKNVDAVAAFFGWEDYGKTSKDDVFAEKTFRAKVVRSHLPGQEVFRHSNYLFHVTWAEFCKVHSIADVLVSLSLED